MTLVKVRLRFEFVEEMDDSRLIIVTSIRLKSEETTYAFPKEYQCSQYHDELFSISTVRNACKALRKKGQFRNVTVTLPSEIVPLYLDDNQNFVFRNNYVEELVENPKSFQDENIPVLVIQIELIKLIEKLTGRLNAKENKLINISHIQKQFVLYKFQGKENAKEWINIFEKECALFDINKYED